MRAVLYSQVDQAVSKESVFIADNYSENKCNTVFAFACMMVSKRWKDKVTLLFGPPGHTHTKNDCWHKILNVDVGQYECATLGVSFEFMFCLVYLIQIYDFVFDRR